MQNLLQNSLLNLRIQLNKDHILHRVWSFVLQNLSLLYITKKTDMIYLKHTTDLQMMYVPKDGRDAKGNVFFKAFSTINQFGFSFDAAEENSSLLYHKVLVELKQDIPSGEYEYTLSDEVGVLSTGLLVIGDLEIPTEYNKEIAYEQYTE